MITERAMLAAVHISIWTAVKHDRKVSRDVADQHGAHQGAGPASGGRPPERAISVYPHTTACPTSRHVARGRLLDYGEPGRFAQGVRAAQRACRGK